LSKADSSAGLQDYIITFVFSNLLQSGFPTIHSPSDKSVDIMIRDFRAITIPNSGSLMTNVLGDPVFRTRLKINLIPSIISSPGLNGFCGKRKLTCDKTASLLLFLQFVRAVF
jgi:hypothetical protein